MFGAEKREYTPKNIFAGDFPTATDTGEAGAALAEFQPVTIDASGKIVAVAPAGTGEGAAAATTGDVVGITAAAAGKGEQVVYFLTGEFFADALALPNGVAVADIKLPLRKIGIFLK